MISGQLVKRFILFGTALVLGGCVLGGIREQMKAWALPGMYSVRTRKTMEYLFINRDHSFSQEIYEIEPNSRIVIQGQWNYYNGELEFSRFLRTHDEGEEYIANYKDQVDYINYISPDFKWREIDISINYDHVYRRFLP